jgi:hypothetical protein
MNIRWTLIFVVISFAQISLAEVPSSGFPENIQYVRDFQKSFGKFPTAVEKILQNHALLMLKGNQSLMPASALDAMSGIYISSSTIGSSANRVVFVMDGLKIERAIKYGEIYILPKGQLLHFQSKEVGTIALYFKGFDLTAVKEIKSEIGHVLGAPKIAGSDMKLLSTIERGLHNIKNILLPSAVADTQANNTPSLCGNAMSGNTGASSPTALQDVWGCTKGLGGGAWDATGGTIWFLLKANYNITFHPIQTFEHAVVEWDKFKAIMSDLGGAFGNFKSAFDDLPTDIKAKFGCELISSIGVSALITYLTVGAGTPAFLRTIMSALQKLIKALPAASPVATKLLALNAKVGSALKSATEAQALIAAGPKGRELITLTKDFKKAQERVFNAQLALETANNEKRTDAAVVKLLGNMSGLPKSNSNVSVAAHELEEAKLAYDRLAKAHADVAAAFKNATPSNVSILVIDHEDVYHELQTLPSLSAQQKAAAALYLSTSACAATNAAGGNDNTKSSNGLSR